MIPRLEDRMRVLVEGGTLREQVKRRLGQLGSWGDNLDGAARGATRYLRERTGEQKNFEEYRIVHICNPRFLEEGIDGETRIGVCLLVGFSSKQEKSEYEYFYRTVKGGTNS